MSSFISFIKESSLISFLQLIIDLFFPFTWIIISISSLIKNFLSAINGEAIYKNGVWAEVIENRKFCGPDKLIWESGLNDDHLDFGIIKPWKGCNPSSQHVMYAHSNSEYIVKGEEQINRFGSGKQSQQITLRE